MLRLSIFRPQFSAKADAPTPPGTQPWPRPVISATAAVWDKRRRTRRKRLDAAVLATRSRVIPTFGGLAARSKGKSIVSNPMVGAPIRYQANPGGLNPSHSRYASGGCFVLEYNEGTAGKPSASR